MHGCPVQDLHGGRAGFTTNHSSRTVEYFVFCSCFNIAPSSRTIYVVKHLSALKTLGPEAGPLMVLSNEAGCDLVRDYMPDLLSFQDPTAHVMHNLQ